MAFKIGKVDVWAADMFNRPGMLARILEALSNAGADLEFVIARRVTENTSRAFFAPITGARQQKAARDVDLSKAAGMHCLRIEGPDRPGLGAAVTRAVAAANINVRGLTAASLGKKSVCYIAFKTDAEAKQASKVIKKALAGK